MKSHEGPDKTLEHIIATRCVGRASGSSDDQATQQFESMSEELESRLESFGKDCSCADTTSATDASITTAEGGVREHEELDDEDYLLKVLMKRSRDAAAGLDPNEGAPPETVLTESSIGSTNFLPRDIPRRASDCDISPQQLPQSSIASPRALDLRRASVSSTSYHHNEVRGPWSARDSRRMRRSLKSSVNSSTSSVQPGAYAGLPGGDYDRLDTIENMQNILNVSSNSVNQSQRRGPSEYETSEHLRRTPALEEEGDEEAATEPHDSSPGDLTNSNTSAKDRSSRYSALLVGAIALFGIALVLSTAIPVVLAGGSTEESSAGQASEPIGHLTKDNGYDLVPGIANYTWEALQVPLSVQSTAFEWVAKDSSWDTYEDWRKQQRFALACIMFATKQKEDSVTTFSNQDTPSLLWSPVGHECEWHFNGFSTMCNEDAIVGLFWSAQRDFEGHLPPEISYLSHLVSLDFSGSGLDNNGVEIDVLLSLSTSNAFASLKELHLSHCGFGGSIPPILGLLTSLTSLDLSMNELESSIPSELSRLINLENLQLSSNFLSGAIPDEIGELSTLLSFNVKDNPALEAFLPDALCSNSRDRVLLISADWCQGNECCPS